MTKEQMREQVELLAKRAGFYWNEAHDLEERTKVTVESHKAYARDLEEQRKRLLEQLEAN